MALSPVRRAQNRKGPVWLSRVLLYHHGCSKRRQILGEAGYPLSGSPCAAQARARPRVARNSNARDCCGLAAAMAISNSHTFWLKFLAGPAAVRRFASKRGWEVFRHDKRQDRQAIRALLAVALNDCASCVGRQSACSQHPPPSRPRPISPIAILERDDFSSNRHLALSVCLSMIFSENRYPLFRIML
jgi:hypothetical protein